MQAIDLAAKLATFTDHWQPRTVGQFNGHDLNVVKLEGEFVWHSHDDTDDLFLVLHGQLTIQLRAADGTRSDVHLGPGQLFVVPQGMEHCPKADEEVHVLIVERTGTPNTGDPETAEPRREI